MNKCEGCGKAIDTDENLCDICAAGLAHDNATRDDPNPTVNGIPHSSGPIILIIDDYDPNGEE